MTENKPYEDMMTLFVGVLAHSEETGEPFNVDPIIMRDIYETMIRDDSLPELSIFFDEEQNRMKFGVRLIKMKDKK